MDNYILNAIFLIIFNLEILYMMSVYQQNQYYIVKYLRTLFRKGMFLTFSGFILLFLSLFLKNNYIISTFALIVCVVIGVVYRYKFARMKVKFRFTPRMIRFFSLAFILNLASFSLLNIFISAPYVILSVCIIFSRFSLIIFHFILMPFEWQIRRGFIFKAEHKLSDCNVITIGITGSYGKTSAKNILNGILKNHFYTLQTPASFNTPLGIAKTINDKLTPLHEIFIAEMGAYKIGEIQEICDFVHPKMGIITTIGKAHLESFGGIENIQIGKFELAECLPNDGLMVINADDINSVNYKIKNDCSVISYGISNSANLQAYDIQVTTSGVNFTVNYLDSEYKFESKLLGLHSVYNILAATSIAIRLGIEMDKIVASVKTLQPIKHRLELVNHGEYILIDDSFNSNPSGAKMAVETLAQMDGYRVIMTPGMIEYGNEEFELNYQLGLQITEGVDFAIIVGEARQIPFVKAFEERNFKKYIVVKDVLKGFETFRNIIEDNKVLLIENDLPDIY